MNKRRSKKKSSSEKTGTSSVGLRSGDIDRECELCGESLNDPTFGTIYEVDQVVADAFCIDTGTLVHNSCIKNSLGSEALKQIHEEDPDNPILEGTSYEKGLYDDFTNEY